MTTTMSVLVIEDDAQIQRYLRALLEGQGYRVFGAETGAQGISQAAMHQPELILLDLGLPDQDGLEVTRQLREWTTTPIIVISARGLEESKITALDLGADDYLTKPFGSGELLARLRVAWRHRQRVQAGSTGAEEPLLEVAALRLDLSKRSLTRDGEEIALTPTEYKLICLLMRHAGRVLTHRVILREVWGPGQSMHHHYVRVHMANLRRKIEHDPAQPHYILTETGVGYRMIEG